MTVSPRAIGKAGPSCADEVDDCLSGPCSTRGTQQVRRTPASVQKLGRRTLSLHSRRRVHGATRTVSDMLTCCWRQCTDGADAYACLCAQGFTGEHCDTDVWAGSQVRAYISGYPMLRKGAM